MIRNSILFIFSLFSCFYLQSQSYWSKTWDSGDTQLANRIKSSHLINDTLYYVSFNVCDWDGQSWNECNTIGMMDAEGNIIKDRLVEGLSVAEYGTIPWRIEEDELIFIDSKGTWGNPTIDIKIFDRYTLDSVATYTYEVRDSLDFNFGSAIHSYGDFYIAAGWCRITGTDIWPDYLLWISKETMQLDTIIEYPFAKESVIPEFIFSNSNDELSIYFSRIDDNGFSGTRGFMHYNLDKEVTFHYEDTIDNRTRHDYPHAAVVMDNGDMIYKQDYSGYDQSWPDSSWFSNFEILCSDKNGDLKWRFNNPGYTYTAEIFFKGSKEIYSLSKTAEGDILACGRTSWHSNYPTFFDFNMFEDTLPPFPDTLLTYKAPYILKLDGDTGELLWQYSILEYTESGKIGPYAFRQVHELSDGSIIGTGWSQTYDADGKYLRDDSWTVKLPPDGCVEEGNMECGFENYLSTSTADLIFIDMNTDKPFVFYPNPSNGLYFARDHRLSPELINYKIIDQTGKIVTSKENVLLDQIDLTTYAGKWYYIIIMDENGKVIQRETLVK